MIRASLLSALLLAAALAPATAGAYQTRHVVIVVIDGARYSETFGDSTYAQVPRQGFDLAPLGCRAVGWNAGVTTTNPGHASVLSGVYQAIANDGSERPHLPLVFEYYRAATGAPRSRTWFFAGKPKLDVMSNSDDPAYGDSLGAFVDASCPTDSAVVARAEALLRSAPPAIVALNLAQTDQIGHTGDWAGYLAAIHRADSLVYDLWLTIQSDTALADRTTLLVTNDHGRHDDAHGGFTNHGCGCDGCRRLQFLALGPDIRAGHVRQGVVQQVDLVPTVGELLGFPTPLAVGQVLTDLFGDEGPAGVGPGAAGPRLRFGAPAPNPARASVHLPLEVPEPGRLKVVVLDAHGRDVATLADGAVAAGSRALAWDGRTAAGRRAAPGVYFVRARLGGRETATRVVLR